MSDRSAGRGSSGGGIVRILALGALAAAVIVVMLAVINRGGDEEATPKTNIVQQLKNAEYKKVGDDRKHDSAEAGREVTDQTWQRAAPPEQVIISDDSPYTTAGVFVVNAVTFTGADGQGQLTCQPDPEHQTSPLTEILADAAAVRAGIKDGSIKPDAETSPDFPYRGEAVGCMP